MTQTKQNRALRIEGMLARTPKIGPQSVHFDIANGCNTRCTTCWHHSRFLHAASVPSAAWKRQRMSFDRFEAILDQVMRLGGLEAIVLSGMGDPSVNPDLYPMVARAHERGIAVTIITNLLRLDIERVMASDGQLDLLTSICGVHEESWQAFHEHPTASGFARLNDQLAELKRRGFKPKHVQVINNQNFHELPDMVRFAKRFPVKRINFKLASLNHGTEAVALTMNERSQLLHDLIPRAEAFAHKYKIDTDLEAFRTQVACSLSGTTETTPIEQTGCFMGYLYARVTVDEEVLFCCNTDLHVGHLKDAPFDALWLDALWQERREALHAGKYFKGCQQCGKYKQNFKWARKLREKLGPDAVDEMIGQAAKIEVAS